MSAILPCKILPTKMPCFFGKWKMNGLFVYFLVLTTRIFFLLDVSKDCKGHEFPPFQRMEYSEAEKLKDPGNWSWLDERETRKGGKFGVQLHWQEKCGNGVFFGIGDLGISEGYPL